jgi:hypothetical protein
MKDLDTNIPTLDLNTIPLMEGANLDVLAIECQLGELPHLEGDQRYEAPDTDRQFRDEMQARSAGEAIGRLPGPREAFHLAISGKFALWDCVPAVLSLAAPATITSLYIATLGFSKANVESMATLLDAGEIGSITLIASHYFKGTSPDIYTHGLETLTARGQRFLSIRSHAKLLAMKLVDGRTVTIEASANLRSCKNIEQLSVFGDPGLFEFHTKWMEGLFA